MLLEDPKNPYNPNAKVNSRRKQVNMLGPEDKKHFSELKTIRKSMNFGDKLGFISDRFIRPRLVNRIHQHLVVRDVLRRERKLDKKETRMRRATQKVHEGAASNVYDRTKKAFKGAQNIAGRVTNNSFVKGVASFGAKHPYLATAAGVGASLMRGTAVDAGSHYLSHKLKMKDPNYAAQTHELARHRAQRTGPFEPILPSHANDPQRGPALHHAQDNYTAPEEARPSSNKKKPDPHKSENAHMTIMRQGTMDMNKINSVGLAAGNKFKLNNETKTNTQKEDCGGVYAAFGMLDRLDEGVLRLAKGVSTFHLKPLTSIGFHIANAITKPIQKARGVEMQQGKHWWSAPKVVKTPVSERAITNADQIYENINEWVSLAVNAAKIGAQAIGKTAVKAAGSSAGRAAIKTGASVAAERGVHAAADKIQQKKASKPTTEDRLDEISANAFRLIRAGRNVALAAGHAYLAHKAHKYIKKKLSGIQNQQPQQEKPVSENIGSQGLSPLEVNPYKTDSSKDIYTYRRNNRISAIYARAKRSPKNFNRARIRASDDPENILNYSKN